MSVALAMVHDSSMTPINSSQPQCNQSEWSKGQITAAYGRQFLVRNAAGATRTARPLGRVQRLVCGDRVFCSVDEQHDELRIESHLQRSSSLWRSDAQGRGELIAANITLLVVVLAPAPKPDFFVIDRYLAAASCAPAQVLLVCNKCDQALTEEAEALLGELRKLDIATLQCSCRSGQGLSELRAQLQPHCGLLVGQSGVGKSSLLAALVPASEQATGELTRAREGRHTTTATRLYSLPDGGELLDSPGVRDFAPALAQLDAAALGFVELRKLAPDCRFSDCRHLQEPHCAVRQAVDTGGMSARRYESYRRLRRQYDALHQSSNRGRR
jgi:ribosome biogenesis GTPase / thiamine phosphate phosphatase